jgi:hypothetical protein
MLPNPTCPLNKKTLNQNQKSKEMYFLHASKDAKDFD